MSRSVSVLRAILLPVMSAVAVAALPTAPAFATLGSYPVALQRCNFSHLDQAGPTAVRLFLKPERRFSGVYFARAGARQDIGPEVVDAGILAKLGDKITSHYAGANAGCTMIVTMAQGRIGVELRVKDQARWPPDIFFIPATSPAEAATRPNAVSVIGRAETVAVG